MISTKDVIAKFSKMGPSKVNMPIMRMFILSFTAGIFISMAGLASCAAAVSIESASVAKLVTALIFPVGLSMVVTNGTELFTGDNLIVISVLDKRIKLKQVLRKWGVIYLGNMAGSLFFTLLCTWGHVFSLYNNELARDFLTIATTKCNISFTDAFIKGIFCNVLVCAAVMMSMIVDTLPGRIAVIYLPVMVFVVCGFEHSVANMSYISGGLFVNSTYGNLGVDVTGLSWYRFLIGNLLPVTLGNVLGGTALGVMYWFTYDRKSE